MQKKQYIQPLSYQLPFLQESVMTGGFTSDGFGHPQGDIDAHAPGRVLYV